MKPGEILSLAVEGLTTNKVRALLTMLGVIIGVAAVIIMIAVSAGTEATIAEQINSLGANLLFVSESMQMGGPTVRSQGSGLVYSDAAAIREISTVSGVVVDQTTSLTVKYDSTSIESVEIVGTSPDFPTVRDVEVAEGRYFNTTDVDRVAKVCVIAPDLATELFGREDPIGKKVTVGTTKLTVIGVMDDKGTVSGTDWDSRLYVPITVVFEKFTPSFFARMTGDSVRMITVQAANQEDIEYTITQIELLLARRHGVSLEDANFQVATQEDIIEMQESTTEAFRSLLGWVAGVSLVVGGIGIMNIMLVTVTERTREIGVRQAVGARGSDIRLQFLSEALMLSLIGGLIGVGCGVGGSWLFGELGDMRTVVVPSSIVLAFSSAAAIGIFFGYYPANKAAQLDPIESLRHE